MLFRSGTPITDYKIERSTGNNVWTTIPHVASSATTFSDTGLSQNTNYSYRVSAINAVGTSDFSSASSPITTWNIPDTIASVTASAGNMQASLSWAAPANHGATITDYSIQYSSNNGKTWTAFNDGASSSTTATITSLAKGTSYIFRVAATNAVGTGLFSSASNYITTWNVPGTPTGLTATVTSSSQINLSWSKPSDGGTPITDYKIERSTGNNVWSTIPHVASSATTFSDTGLSANTSYSYRVSAINAVGTGSASSTAKATTLTAAPTVPGQPTNLVAKAGVSKISLTWTAPSDGGSPITGYKIQRSTDNTNWSTLVSSTGTKNTSYTDSGLLAGAKYYYKVSAINKIGTGPASTSAFATVK